ncbi:nucleoside deaminase [Segetibacter sp. 3557_3]|uniref:nucleoside deaminase n=1 Tax=Segetibacter sp. 3557_3 TaxID=2547429 RepID=UPI0010586740|nr:nucleoside deaminase [Segetibacter sp. 3557_3]TDH28635.1 nucleoside deaminase [Segetibacter sp. 3557_3]
MANEPTPDHFSYMRQCIVLAGRAKARGDSPVGSLVICRGKVIGEGIEGAKTFNDITFHAEIEAIRQATKLLKSMDLSACMLVTTHEPCIMCSYVIRHHRLHTVYFGLSSGEIGGYSSKHTILTDDQIGIWHKPPQVIGGILSDEVRELHV